ncbi:hypothetical protein Tco_0270460 [Tanacetum coccineum]
MLSARDLLVCADIDNAEAESDSELFREGGTRERSERAKLRERGVHSLLSRGPCESMCLVRVSTVEHAEECSCGLRCAVASDFTSKSGELCGGEIWRREKVVYRAPYLIPSAQFGGAGVVSVCNG